MGEQTAPRRTRSRGCFDVRSGASALLFHHRLGDVLVDWNTENCTWSKALGDLSRAAAHARQLASRRLQALRLISSAEPLIVAMPIGLAAISEPIRSRTCGLHCST